MAKRARKRTTRRRRPARRTTRTRRRSNMVMANPTRKRRRRRRAAPKATRRRARRRRNPTVRWSDAFFGTLKGSAGGAVVYGIDYGAGYAKVSEYGRAGITGGVGLLTSILLGKWMPQAGAGVAGATTFAVISRVKLAMDLAGKGGPANGVQQEGSGPRFVPPGFRQAPREGGRVFDFARMDAGRVTNIQGPRVRQLAAPGLPTGARTTLGTDAGASRYVIVGGPGARRYGSGNSWTQYYRDGGRVMKVVNRFGG